jgi:hypothetical protein
MRLTNWHRLYSLLLGSMANIISSVLLGLQNTASLFIMYRKKKKKINGLFQNEHPGILL